ncbi:hypothetical protein RJ640_026776 [Escallonia rubra]|uniref:Methyltransferase type 11 domain-containing protein n=1 Tax=Escallonia rubra TaxID=112253 RepID=A0AA88RJF9_9ASTE|nr:hypothetical protein RJ640_026776 [Escallonia rubra]
MADLFLKQAKQYSEGRPSYPRELFDFIASTTHTHDLAWDVGTGNGQAAASLAGIFKNVIATDTSLKQLEFAPKLPNVRYQCTPPVMSMAELEHDIAAQASVDLVTIAQAVHYFDLPNFYRQVKWILKSPNGVIAAWCYTSPEVNDNFDSVFLKFYNIDAGPYWHPARKLVDDKYKGINFPFEPVDGFDHTGPFEFKLERLMSLEEFFTYLRSWSAYQTAREKGIELLRDDVREEFKRAWTEDGIDHKVVKFPVHLRVGKVGNLAKTV